MWLSGIEIFISIIWLIQTISFYSNLTILNNCTNCRILSHITIFLYIADWVILGLTIKQFKKIMLNPLDAILKPDKNIIYLNIKGILDKNFSHLHLTDTDVKKLIEDLQLIERLKEKGVTNFKIDYNLNK